MDSLEFCTEALADAHMVKPSHSLFKFRKHERIGAEGAEEDREFLLDCFVDTGDLPVLADTVDPRRILVGRTGAGKTALLLKLASGQEHVAWIQPDELALQYLSNSTILKHLDEIGVDLDVFYRLLWRHILAVELIRLKYRVNSEEDQRRFFDQIRDLFGTNKRKKAALDYLFQWGERFWEDTEARVHEVTKTLEQKVATALGGNFGGLIAEAGADSAQKVEDRKELVHRIQEVVNSVQIQKLGEILRALADDVFDDPQEQFYVIIDRLDEHWVEERFRYRLVRALIETVKDLQKIRSAKVILSLRMDLLQRVFRETRSSGFQEEKYEPLFLRLRWPKHSLIEVLDLRIRKLIRRQYTKRAVSWQEIFPRTVAKRRTAQFIVERTLYRPRDIIQFANFCLESAEGRSEVSVTTIRQAEGRYSERRFRSLGDEWFSEYPDLLTHSSILRRRPKTFAVKDISPEEVSTLCVRTIGGADEMKKGRIRPLVRLVFSDDLSLEDLRSRLVKMFYDVGIVGIRLRSGESVLWSFVDEFGLTEAEIGEGARLQINPTFFRVLGVDPR